MFERRKLLPDLHGNRTGYVAFIGKIQFSFNESPRIDKSLGATHYIVCADYRKPLALPAVAALGFRSNEVGQTFCNRQVHLAVGKSTSRKFTSLRNSASRQFAQHRKHLFHNGLTAVQMKFGAVFPVKL